MTEVVNFPEKYFIAFLAPTWIASENGRTLRSPTGEIALSEIQIVFVKVSICPETMKSHPESLRETHFEATATCFEFAPGISLNSPGPRSAPPFSRSVPFSKLKKWVRKPRVFAKEVLALSGD